MTSLPHRFDGRSLFGTSPLGVLYLPLDVALFASGVGVLAFGVCAMTELAMLQALQALAFLLGVRSLAFICEPLPLVCRQIPLVCDLISLIRERVPLVGDRISLVGAAVSACQLAFAACGGSRSPVRVLGGCRGSTRELICHRDSRFLQRLDSSSSLCLGFAGENELHSMEFAAGRQADVDATATFHVLRQIGPHARRSAVLRAEPGNFRRRAKDAPRQTGGPSRDADSGAWFPRRSVRGMA
jgi:hypothetical protein